MREKIRKKWNVKKREGGEKKEKLGILREERRKRKRNTLSMGESLRDRK